MPQDPLTFLLEELERREEAGEEAMGGIAIAEEAQERARGGPLLRGITSQVPWYSRLKEQLHEAQARIDEEEYQKGEAARLEANRNLVREGVITHEQFLEMHPEVGASEREQTFRAISEPIEPGMGIPIGAEEIRPTFPGPLELLGNAIVEGERALGAPHPSSRLVESKVPGFKLPLRAGVYAPGSQEEFAAGLVGGLAGEAPARLVAEAAEPLLVPGAPAAGVRQFLEERRDPSEEMAERIKAIEQATAAERANMRKTLELGAPEIVAKNAGEILTGTMELMGVLTTRGTFEEGRETGAALTRGIEGQIQAALTDPITYAETHPVDFLLDVVPVLKATATSRHVAPAARKAAQALASKIDDMALGEAAAALPGARAVRGAAQGIQRGSKAVSRFLADPLSGVSQEARALRESVAPGGTEVALEQARRVRRGQDVLPERVTTEVPGAGPVETVVHPEPRELPPPRREVRGPELAETRLKEAERFARERALAGDPGYKLVEERRATVKKRELFPGQERGVVVGATSKMVPDAPSMVRAMEELKIPHESVLPKRQRKTERREGPATRPPILGDPKSKPIAAILAREHPEVVPRALRDIVEEQRGEGRQLELPTASKAAVKSRAERAAKQVRTKGLGALAEPVTPSPSVTVRTTAKAWMPDKRKMVDTSFEYEPPVELAVPDLPHVSKWARELVGPERKGADVRKFVESEYAKVLDERSPLILKSTKLRQMVLDEASRQHPGRAARAFKGQVRKLLKEMAKTPKDEPGIANNFVVHVGKKQIDLLRTAQEILAKNKGTRRAITTDVMEQVASHIGGIIAKEATLNKLDVLRRPGDKLLRTLPRTSARRISQGEAVPAILPFDPKKSMRAPGKGEVKDVSLVAALDLVPDSRAAARASDALGRYRRVAVGEKGLAGKAAESLGLKKGEAVWMSKPDVETLGFQQMLADSLSTSSIGMRLTRWAKANMSARNPPTHINNFLSNMMMQMLRRADPAVFPKLAKEADAYLTWRKGGVKRTGKPFSKEDQLMYEGAQASGLLQTTHFDAEVGSIGAALSDVGIGEIRAFGRHYSDGAWRKLNKAMDATYKWGDNLFKLEEYVGNYRKLTADLKMMESGTTITFETTRKKRVTLTKKADGVYLEGKKLSQEQLALVKGRAAGRAANDLIFDYTDVPHWLALLRRAPVGGMASMYATWAWKAMDAPGKRGLLSRMFQEGVPVVSTSKRVRAAQTADRIQRSLRMTAYTQSMQAMVKQGEPRELKKILQWRANREPLMVVNLITNPLTQDDVVGTKDFSSANPFGPTGSVLNLFSSMRAILGTPESAKGPIVQPEDWKTEKDVNDFLEWAKMEPEQRKFWKRMYLKEMAGHFATWEDTMDLLGLAGSPFLEAYQELSKSDRPVNQARLTRGLLAAVIGGHAAIGLDAAVSGLEEAGVLMPDDTAFEYLSRRQRHFEKEPGGAAKEYADYFTKLLLGAVGGWNFRSVSEDTERYYERADRDIGAGTWKVLEKEAKVLRSRAKALRKRAEPARAEAMEARAAEKEAAARALKHDMRSALKKSKADSDLYTEKLRGR